MADLSRLSDPAANYRFSRDYGAGRFHLRLAAEAARWLKARRKSRGRGAQEAKRARCRSWRASQ